MDQMDPPLAYQRAAGKAGDEVDGALSGEFPKLTFDTRGLEVITPGRAYMLDLPIKRR